MSEAYSTLLTTRRGLADAIDGYDDQIAVLQNAKSEGLKAYRAELLKAGYEQADVRLEIEAFKAAVRKRRAAAKNPEAVEERDVLVAEIYNEISSPRARTCVARHAHAHVREDEVASLPAADASSSESRKGSVPPDVVPQEHLSGPEAPREHSEAAAQDFRPVIEPAARVSPVTLADGPEKPPSSTTVENAKPAMVISAPFAAGPQTDRSDRSDPGPIPDFLRRAAPEMRAARAGAT